MNLIRESATHATVFWAVAFTAGCGSSPTAPAGGAVLTAVSTAMQSTCALTEAGTVRCWGDDSFGSLGDGRSACEDTGCIKPPVTLALNEPVATLEAADNSRCAITVSGNTFCWGKDGSGNLGFNSLLPHCQVPAETTAFPPEQGTPCVPVPRMLSTPVPLVSISVSNTFSCGLGSDSLVYCWGADASGALGLGYDSISVPTPIDGDIQFSDVRVSWASWWFYPNGMFACGLASGGGAYCWGDNESGQLGNGTFSESRVPLLVSESEDFQSITAGSAHSCALSTSGQAFCWGNNDWGQLGDATAESSPRPVEVSSELRFIAINAGARHTCGIATGGRLYCWGSGSALGLGTSARVTKPAPVATSLGFVSVDAGFDYSCAVSEQGGLFCWGENWSNRITTDENENVAFAVPIRLFVVGDSV